MAVAYETKLELKDPPNYCKTVKCTQMDQNVSRLYHYNMIMKTDCFCFLRSVCYFWNGMMKSKTLG